MIVLGGQSLNNEAASRSVSILSRLYYDGAGKHTPHVMPAELILVNKWSIISEILAVLSSMFVK